MSASALNPHVTITSPFGVADLPTLFCWRQRIRKADNEPAEDLDEFMEERFVREGVKTFAAYRDEELGGYFEAVPGELRFDAQAASAAVAKVEMCFKHS